MTVKKIKGVVILENLNISFLLLLSLSLVFR
jgi:hypothetical protein